MSLLYIGTIFTHFHTSDIAKFDLKISSWISTLWLHNYFSSILPHVFSNSEQKLHNFIGKSCVRNMSLAPFTQSKHIQNYITEHGQLCVCVCV